MTNCEWTILENDHGEKLLVFLKKNMDASFSNRKIKAWIDAGLCLVNGRVEKFHHTRLSKKDRVQVRIPAEQDEKRVEFTEARCLFEDDLLLVYDKPPGVTCDDKGLVALIGEYKKIELIHRLDKDTSGVIIMAKEKSVTQNLEEQFRERKIKKEYVALVHGKFEKDRGTIVNYLGPVSKSTGGQIWGDIGGKKGSFAHTDWECVICAEPASFVRLYPFTGRTHQLRVHMSQLHHPIIGDSVYGKTFYTSESVIRQMLHAEKISFMHPHTGKMIEVVAPIPEDFKKAFTSLFQKQL